MRLLPLLLFAACAGDSVRARTDESGTPLDCAVSEPGRESAAVLVGAAPRNLLVISIDTLRRDRVGRYSGLDTTPFLDRLLDESLALDDHRACANWTLPGVTCAQTGRAPLELGVDPVSADPAHPTRNLPADMETIATWLAAAGYDTRLRSGARLFSDAYPIGNGFASVVYDDDAPASDVAQLGLEALDGATSPWYLHLHFRDPHSPYHPPAAYQGALDGVELGELDPRTRSGVEAIAAGWRGMSPDALADLREQLELLYRGEVRYLDDALAGLWTELEARGALEDTLVVIWSDHGEQFFEHDGFQHEASLHQEEGMAVGAFWARSLEARAWEGPTTQVDLAPTILSILGQPIPSTVTGHVVGTAPANRVRVSSANTTRDIPLQSVDQDGWRLLYAWNGQRSLYHVRTDPNEANDVYRLEPARVRCLWEHLGPVVAAIDPAGVGMEPEKPAP